AESRPVLRDFIYAYRLLRKSPVATIVAVLALGLGVGANVSSFVAVNALLLHPFAYPNLDRIMTVWESVRKMDSEREGVSPLNLADWKEQNHSFEQLAAYRQWTVNLT